MGRLAAVPGAVMSDLSDEARRAKAVTLANSSRATNPIVITVVKPVDRYGTFDAYC